MCSPLRHFFVFGPVPSRRLGRSLGVNNVPYKTCSYSCAYCQLGKTTHLTVERSFYEWRLVVEAVTNALRDLSEQVDYVTFVPTGEPTLDACIGREIEAIKAEMGARVAVLTNASLLHKREVREDLAQADYVSVKLDAASESVWKAVNRPHPSLSLDAVLEGLEDFSREFRGRLVAETMLVDRLNAGTEVEGVAERLERLKLFKAYIAVPTRPPAEPYARPPPPERLVEAYEVFSRHLGQGRVELLNAPEPPSFTAHGDPAAWLLATAAVHPLRHRHALSALRELTDDPEGLVRELVSRGELNEVQYGEELFLVRSFKHITPRA